MNLLSRLRIRSKLGLMLVLFAAGLAASVSIDGSILLQRMRNDRVDKLKAVVSMAVSDAAALQKQVDARQITPDQELARLRDMLHAMRYDGGNGYVAVETLQGLTLIHGADPSREGRHGTAKDSSGRPIIELIQDAVRTSNSGIVHYMFPKPGHTEPLPKVSYVELLPPLNAVFLAGAYTDDLESNFHSEVMRSASIGCVLLLILLGLAWLVNRDISGSLDRLKEAMTLLAGGNLAVDTPGTGRQDEVGEMAAAVQVFKNDAIKMRELKATQEAEEKRAAEDKRQTMGRIANQFESSVGGIVGSVASAAAEMETTAGSMSTTAERSVQQVTAVATASSQASENVQSVASAAEELASSVSEISRHVASSSAIAAKAVSESERTNVMVNGLSDAAQKIGAVTNMISEIASRTNLLALNATIEAARAGDAGKGFAVVAAEVKNLANQTGKATDEISRHIADMQKATGETVTAIQTIAATITQINEIATTIAAAVEEQGAATQEIARNIQQVAAGTAEVTQTIAAFSQGSSETGTASSQMLEAARMLSKQAAQLTQEVGRFIADVKAA